MTPMVDVMLVLLIIFMVITPMLSKGVSVDMVKTQESHPHAGGGQERRDHRRGHARRQDLSGHHADAAAKIFPPR